MRESKDKERERERKREREKARECNRETMPVFSINADEEDVRGSGEPLIRHEVSGSKRGSYRYVCVCLFPLWNCCFALLGGESLWACGLWRALFLKANTFSSKSYEFLETNEEIREITIECNILSYSVSPMKTIVDRISDRINGVENTDLIEVRHVNIHTSQNTHAALRRSLSVAFLYVRCGLCVHSSCTVCMQSFVLESWCA